MKTQITQIIVDRKTAEGVWLGMWRHCQRNKITAIIQSISLCYHKKYYSLEHPALMLNVSLDLTSLQFVNRIVLPLVTLTCTNKGCQKKSRVTSLNFYEYIFRYSHIVLVECQCELSVFSSSVITRPNDLLFAKGDRLTQLVMKWPWSIISLDDIASNEKYATSSEYFEIFLFLPLPSAFCWEQRTIRKCMNCFCPLLTDLYLSWIGN